MKRIYSFMVAAVAMFAAAACTQELENVEPEVNGESVVFTAYADGADETKTALSGNKSLWKSGDRIWILNGKEGDTGWKKGYSTTDNSATATFTEEDNSYALEGEQYFAVYPAAAADNATWEGGDVLGVTLKSVQDATAGSYDPAAHIAVAKSTTTSLKFKNAVSLLKFTVKNEGVKSVTIYAREGGLLTGSCNISAEGTVTPWTGEGEANGWVELSAGEGTFAVGTEYYIAVFPNTDEANLTAGFTVQFSFGGAKYDVKSYTKALTLNRNEILDLGELEYAAAERAETVYLCPGVWSADGAWFAAYFFGTAGEATAVEMTENDGVYSCDVPGDYENVIFCRMNPDFTEFGWDVTEGEGENVEVTEDHVWNQSADLNVPLAGDTKVYYNVTAWEAGEWSDTPQENTPEVVEKEWGIVGTMTSWTDNISMTLVDGWYVAEDVTITTSDEFKFRVGTTWDELKTYNATTIEDNTEYSTVDGQGDGNGMKVAVSAIYSVYLSADAATMKVVKTGDIPLPEVKNWGIVGSITSWGDVTDITMALEGDWYIAYAVEMPAGTEFKFRVDNTWASEGGEELTYAGSVVSGTEYNVSGGASNISITSGAVYDVYLSRDETKMKVVKVADLPEPDIMAKDGYVYLLPNSNWTQASARFAIYLCNGSKEATWISMTKVDGTAYYEAELPDDFSYANYKNIIFVRMNPSSQTNNWDNGNKWNQSGDLDSNQIVNGKNCCAINDGQWDCGTNVTWSTVTKLN